MGLQSGKKRRAPNKARKKHAHSRRNIALERLQRFIALSSDFYWEQDAHYRFVFIQGSDEQTQQSRKLIGKTLWALIAKPLDLGGWAAHRALLDAHQPFADRVFEIKASPDESRLVSINGEPMFDRRGKFRGYRGIARDVTAQKRAEQALRDSEERFRRLTELSSDWYWEMDDRRRFSRFEGHGKEELTRYIGKTAHELGFEVAGGWDAHDTAFASLKRFQDLVLSIKSNDEIRYVAVSGEPLFDANGKHTGHRGISRNITERMRAEAQIRHLAAHDALTGLTNRAMFGRILTHAVESTKHDRRKFAVLFIDLDRFKLINDTLGHEAGDGLLVEMAIRLKECLHTNDVVARLGGDEFVVLIQKVDDASQVVAVARKLLAAVAKPMVLYGHECRVTASIGVAVYPSDAEDEQSLMKHADMAMYSAKEEGRNNFQFYSANIKPQSLEQLTLETNLRRALEREEFSLHYQAKVDLKTNTITGVEALIRWQSPVLGNISPMHFIPLAEETGVIAPIGRWVLRAACLQNVAWQRQGLPPVGVAVNLSMRQFQDENLLSDIREALAESQLQPELLELEITEGMVAQNVERAANVLSAIRAIGVRLAIDDFGTGYSSLAQLKRFPIDTLKVDRSLIRDLPTDAEDKAITEAIIAMAKALGLIVVAEGVETSEQAEFLRRHACDEAQGYYFSKPVAAEQFAELLRGRWPRK